MQKIMSRIIARPTGVKLLVLFGLLGSFASYAMADTSYTVTMVETGFFTLPTDNTTNPSAGTNTQPGAGYCYGLIASGTTGTLTLLSSGGLTLSFGNGLGQTGGCGASLSGASLIGSTPGSYATLTGTMCNDGSCNGPINGNGASVDHAQAGYVPSLSGHYFVVADNYPPPGSNCSPCSSGGSLDFLLSYQTSSVPEPSSASTGLIGLGVLGLGMLVRRRVAAR